MSRSGASLGGCGMVRLLVVVGEFEAKCTCFTDRIAPFWPSPLVAGEGPGWAALA